MKNKKNIHSNNRSTFVRIAVSVIIASTVCGAGFAFMVNQINTYKSDYITVYGNNQELLVNEAAKQAAEILNSDEENTETLQKSVIDNVISRSESNGSRYWIFSEQDSILLFNNHEKTLALGDISISELAKGYKNNGGKNIDELMNIINQKQNGSVLYSPSNVSANLLTSFNFFSAGGKEYAIAMTTTEHYMFMQGKINQRTTYLFLFTAVSIAVVLILVTANTVSGAKKDKQILRLTNELKEKNTLIENINLKLRENSSGTSFNPESQDSLTGAYSKEFMMAVLDKITDIRLLPAAVIALEPDCKSNAASADTLLKISEILSTITTSNDIVSVDGSCFIVLLTRSSLQYAEKLTEKAQRQYQKDFPNEKLNTAIYMKNNLTDSAESILNEIKHRLHESFAAIK